MLLIVSVPFGSRTGFQSLGKSTSSVSHTRPVARAGDAARSTVASLKRNGALMSSVTDVTAIACALGPVKVAAMPSSAYVTSWPKPVVIFIDAHTPFAVYCAALSPANANWHVIEDE